MPKAKMGGKSFLKILLRGGDDLADSLLSVGEGGRALPRGLRGLMEEKQNAAFQVELIREPCNGSCLPAPDGGNGLGPQSRSLLFDETIDVVALSMQPDILGSAPVQQFKDGLLRLIRAIKQHSGAHIIAYNCSSLDPEDATYNYHGVGEPLSVRIQRFNLALLECSVLEGISIIDADRLVAELGGLKQVEKALCYSAGALQGTAREFLRVLEDIGFFENRPLLKQLGRRKTA